MSTGLAVELPLYTIYYQSLNCKHSLEFKLRLEITGAVVTALVQAD